jgi:hypothetical protein
MEYLIAICIIHHELIYHNENAIAVLEENDLVGYYDGYWLTDAGYDLYAGDLPIINPHFAD